MLNLSDKKIKKAPKLLIITFLIIFIFQMIGIAFLFASPDSVNAQIEFDQQVDIGDSNITPTDIKEGKGIGMYISAIYKYAIGIVGIIAAVVLMFGGVVWLTAGGNQTRIGEAKSWIAASLSGLVIALTSYMILATVNPNVVDLRPINVAVVKPHGCCLKDNKNIGSMIKESCEKQGGSWYKDSCPSSENTDTCTTNADCFGSDFDCIQGFCSNGEIGSKCDSVINCKKCTIGEKICDADKECDCEEYSINVGP